MEVRNVSTLDVTSRPILENIFTNFSLELDRNMKVTNFPNVLLLIGSSWLYTTALGQTLPYATTSYNCADPQNAQCGSGSDRFYELIAVYGQYKVNNYPPVRGNTSYAYARVRSFEGGVGFANSEKSNNNVLGPNLKVKVRVL